MVDEDTPREEEPYITLSWNGFVNMFKENYQSEENLRVAREKFLTLEQGSKIIKEYIQEFTLLK